MQAGWNFWARHWCRWNGMPACGPWRPISVAEENEPIQAPCLQKRHRDHPGCPPEPEALRPGAVQRSAVPEYRNRQNDFWLSLKQHGDQKIDRSLACYMLVSTQSGVPAHVTESGVPAHVTKQSGVTAHFTRKTAVCPLMSCHMSSVTAHQKNSISLAKDSLHARIILCLNCRETSLWSTKNKVFHKTCVFGENYDFYIVSTYFYLFLLISTYNLV